MNEFVIVYVWLALQNAVGILGFAAVFASIVFLLFVSILAEEDEDELPKTAKQLGIFCVLSWGFFVPGFILVPSEDEMKTIIGAGAVWRGIRVAQDVPGAEELPENVIRAMNTVLEAVKAKEGED